MDLLTEAQQVLEQAELIYSAEQVHRVIEQLADNINQQLADVSQPVIVLPIMNGGLVLAGQLIPQLKFPLFIDYLHATRYRNSTRGHEEIHWRVRPQHELKGQTLLLIDDIYDEGHTLQSIVDFCRQQGAARVYSAVLVVKDHPRETAMLESDFSGLRVEDRYVFGFGMDYKGYHRNLNGIYGVKE